MFSKVKNSLFKGFARRRRSPAIEAREEVVTVLFLDIMGFSAASLLTTPQGAFSDLKSMFDRITRIVNRHGGTVDRTLGDGLLAYFTPEDTTTIIGSHADRALECAVAIHADQIKKTLSNSIENRISVFPVRIGVNSGSVYMGDLGNEERRDFTIIGTTVNFGQRLEAACEINRIMLGETTLELAEKFSKNSLGMKKRPIIAKSYQAPVDAYEYDPFVQSPELNRDFIAAYRNFAQMNRLEDRLDCEKASLLMVTNHGHATIVNVSRSGVMLRFDQYIARGVVIYVSQVIAKIEHLNTPPLFLEIRWGSAEESGSYLHGCMLKNLNDDQNNELWEMWQTILDRSEN